MSPFYSFRYPLSLSPDDRRGIQYLYGRPQPAPTSKTPALGPRAGMDTNEIAPLEVRLKKGGALPLAPCPLLDSDCSLGSSPCLLTARSQKLP